MENKKKCAVFTIARDEKIFLPIWLRYYKKYFDNEDIYVLDHETIDGSTDNLDVNVTRLNFTEIFNHDWLISQVQQKQQELLNKYDVVVFTEIDEFLAAPKFAGGLREFIDTVSENGARCVGYHVLHDVEVEPELDVSRPVLEQRGIWIRDTVYDKPLITKIPLTYVPGFHHSNPALPSRDDLFLIHLHRVDIEIAWARNLARSNKDIWNKEAIEKRWSYDNLSSSRQEFESHFFDRFKDYKRESIPEDIRKVII